MLLLYIQKKKKCTECASLFLCVNHIDTDLSEMSVHLLIHAAPPPDSMLSNCQTSLKGESYHHTFLVYMIARKKLNPANITLMDFSPTNISSAQTVGLMSPKAMVLATYVLFPLLLPANSRQQSVIFC